MLIFYEGLVDEKLNKKSMFLTEQTYQTVYSTQNLKNKN